MPRLEKQKKVGASKTEHCHRVSTGNVIGIENKRDKYRTKQARRNHNENQASWLSILNY